MLLQSRPLRVAQFFVGLPRFDVTSCAVKIGVRVTAADYHGHAPTDYKFRVYTSRQKWQGINANRLAHRPYEFGIKVSVATSAHRSDLLRLDD